MKKQNHPCCTAMRIKPFLSFSVRVKLPGRASNASLAPPTRRTTALPRPLRVNKYSMLCLLQEQNPVCKHKHMHSLTQTEARCQSIRDSNTYLHSKHNNFSCELRNMVPILPSLYITPLNFFQSKPHYPFLIVQFHITSVLKLIHSPLLLATLSRNLVPYIRQLLTHRYILYS